MTAASRVNYAPHLPDFIRLALNTGMRRGEMLGLEWRRVDLSEGLVYLEPEHQKNGKVGSVPLNREARSAIASRMAFRARHCPNSPWVFAHRNGSQLKSVKHSFATACRIADIDNFRVHAMRHTCAAWRVQAGVSILEVAALLRHSDLQVTMRYAHLKPDSVHAAVSVLDSPPSRSGHVDPDEGERIAA